MKVGEQAVDTWMGEGSLPGDGSFSSIQRQLRIAKEALCSSGCGVRFKLGEKQHLLSEGVSTGWIEQVLEAPPSSIEEHEHGRVKVNAPGGWKEVVWQHFAVNGEPEAATLMIALPVDADISEPLFADLVSSVKEEIDLRAKLPPNARPLSVNKDLLAELFLVQQDFATTDIKPDEIVDRLAQSAVKLSSVEAAKAFIVLDQESYEKNIPESGWSDPVNLNNLNPQSEATSEKAEVFSAPDDSSTVIGIRAKGKRVGWLAVRCKQESLDPPVKHILRLLAELGGGGWLRARKRHALRASEERHRTLLAHLPVGVYRSTPDGCMIEANETAIELLGCPDMDTLQRIPTQRFFVDENVRKELLETVKKEGVATREFKLRQYESGEVIWVRDHLRGIKDEDGHLKHLDGVIVDITQRREAEQKLASSEARLRTIAENVSDVIAIFNDDGSLKQIFGAVKELFGVTPEHILEDEPMEYVHYDDQHKIRNIIRDSVLNPGKVVKTEFRFARADGKWRHLELRGRNLLDQSGVQGILCVLRDITRKKQYEKKLVQAKERAQEMARLKSVFLANMSHEIRTPLTGILGFADVLAEEIDGEAIEFVDLIRQGGRRLSDTLNSVLDLARLEAGKVEVDLHQRSVAESLESAANIFENNAHQKGLDFKLELPDSSLKMMVDDAAFDRVVANLLSNAVKFTDEGYVAARAYADEDQVIVEVEDTGVGMSEAFQEELFNEFRQESSGLSREHEGAGLGLSITQKLVDMMGGSIEVESEKEKGSTFKVALNRPDQPAKRDSEEEDNEEMAELDTDGKIRRLLVLEDNKDTRLLLKHLLKDHWEADLMETPEEAFEKAQSEKYDAALVDINLGKGKTGVDFVKRLRDELKLTFPAIAVTAFAMPGDRERFLEAGFDSYLAKPFTRPKLYSAIGDVLDDADD